MPTGTTIHTRLVVQLPAGTQLKEVCTTLQLVSYYETGILGIDIRTDPSVLSSRRLFMP
jgi:hypothetical protein